MANKIYVFKSIDSGDLEEIVAPLLIDALVIMFERELTNYLHISTKETN